MGSHHSARAGSDVWLTPPGVVTALGAFDLDPCAAEPRPWDTARRHIAPPDDGLAATWEGRVFLNPPYSNLTDWLGKLADHGRGTALIFARTETRWFVDLVWQRASAVMFLHGRLHFHLPDGSRARGNAGAPSCLVAYGDGDALRLAGSGLAGTFVNLGNSSLEAA
ncbi:DNA N-6-adenine-methyltransferase [Nocardia xishanensis]|uniref:DNA N-6-adenine-methyltransferase n=1 Tax=Nocardia xishanensis TaxID=238964 RepID=UPI000A040D09|nr:DNA N-6-adenine-methyltransferase [Nocardia xishanensis]